MIADNPNPLELRVLLITPHVLKGLQALLVAPHASMAHDLSADNLILRLRVLLVTPHASRAILAVPRRPIVGLRVLLITPRARRASSRRGVPEGQSLVPKVEPLIFSMTLVHRVRWEVVVVPVDDATRRSLPPIGGSTKETLDKNCEMGHGDFR